MLITPDAITAAVEVCSGADLYKPAHSSIFDAICTLYAEGALANPVTVADELRRVDLLDSIGGPATLIDLQANCPATTGAKRYATIVRRDARLRAVITTASEIREAAFDQPDQVPDLMASLVSLVVLERAGGAHLVRVSEVVPERVDWLWPGYLPRGKVVLLDGDPGLGKSTVTLDLAARLTTASPFPDGVRPAFTGGVVLLSAEDGIADTIRPRLEAAGADLDQVVVLDHVIREDGTTDAPSLPGDMGAIRQAVADVGAALVVVDPLMAFLHGTVNSYRDQDVRRALHPLKVLAEDTGATVLLVRHLNKSPAANAIYRGGGSIGIIGGARLGLLVAPDPDDERRRILAVVKSNLAAMPSALAYRLVSSEEHGCARVLWEGSTSHTADELLIQPATDEDRSAFSEAKAWLTDYLSVGGRAARKTISDAATAGHAEKTIRRAKGALGVRSVKTADEWHWVLPDQDGQPPIRADQGSELGHLGHLDAQPADQDIPAVGGGRGLQDGQDGQRSEHGHLEAGTAAPMTASVTTSASSGSLTYLDLARTEACRRCHATTAMGDDEGAICRRCFEEANR